MSKVAIKGNASGTGTFTVEAPNSNTDRTLVLPDEAGTVLTSASDISSSQLPTNGFFHATITGSQSITASTATVITFNTESIDTEGWYNSSTYTYTPQIAGWYEFSAKISVGNTGSARTILGFEKNGSGGISNRAFDFGINSLTTGLQASGVYYYYANGTTDNFRAIVWADLNETVRETASADGTYFTGKLVRAD